MGIEVGEVIVLTIDSKQYTGRVFKAHCESKARVRYYSTQFKKMVICETDLRDCRRATDREKSQFLQDAKEHNERCQVIMANHKRHV